MVARLRQRAKPLPTVSVPRLWPNSTIVCIAGGPSLTAEDVNYCKGKARVLVVNDGYRLAPWADVLYACDAKWWRWHGGVPSFPGLKYTLAHPQTTWPDIHGLQNTGRDGLEIRPTGLKTGSNSGYQALNLAVHLGAARIILLGYDMQRDGARTHWFGEHPEKSTLPYTAFIQYFGKLAPILKKHGVDVVNCSRRTALTCFQKQSLAQALPESMAVAS